MIEETTTTTEPSVTSVTSAPAAEPLPDSSYPFAGKALTEQQVAQVIDLLNQAKAVMPPMPDLTGLQLRRLSRPGLKTQGFLQAAMEAVQKDPGMLPQAVALEELRDQEQFYRDLSLIQTHLSDLKTKTDTALALTGNHLYAVSRFVYTALNKTSLGKGKMTEQTAYMKERFALKKKGQPSATAPVTA